MSKTLSLKDTIEAMLTRNRVPKTEGRAWYFLQEDEATSADRVFLETWRRQVDDPIWSRTVAAVQVHFPNPALWMVMMALRTNRWAERARVGIDCFLEQQREKRKKHLELADTAEALATYLSQLDQMTATYYNECLHPVEEMVRLHRKQADFSARKEPEPTVPMSRQDRRGEHSGLRARRAFIHLIHKEFTELRTGESAGNFNFVEPTVAFARIKFPEVDAEVVRKTLEPTTREGRRRQRANPQNPKPDHRAA
jgi:hypothetical protein